jgi:Protein of unknown function (DUF1579)
MRTRTVVVAVGLALCLALATSAPAGAQQGEKKLTPEQQAAMDAWMKVATPGEGHKLLEPLIGSWNVQSTMWEKPGEPPQKGAGLAEASWVLGGRFVKEEFQGDFGGMKFQGLGYTGYDNYKKKYIGSWMDTMGTMMMTSIGTVDASGKVFTSTSHMDDVMTGKPMTVRMVTRIVDNNKRVMEMFGPDPSGKEFKMMEIVYLRK